MTERSGRGRPRGPSWRDDRVWQAGFLVGSALGAAATVVGRRAERSARRGLVDWPEVERIAIGRLAAAPGHARRGRAAAPPSRPTPRRWRGSCRRSSAALGPSCRASSSAPASSTGPAGSGPTSAPSRRSSASSRRTCSTRSSRPAAASPRRRWPSPTAGSRRASSASCSGSWARASSASTTSPCCRPRQAPGRLLFVEENIRATARALGVPLGPFRTWIALHETTHAFEFEAHPWLRPYLAERLERQLTLFGTRRRGLGREAIRGLGRALRGEGGGEHWMERLMGPSSGAVPRDPGGDEPARGLQRLRHGRGRARPRARTSSGSARGSTSGARSGRRSSGRCSG